MVPTKNNTVVLVNPPNKKIVLRDMYSSTISKGLYNWPCVDLLALSGILKASYGVRLIDANTLRLTVDEAVDRIISLRPKAIVFSFGNSVKNDDYRFVKILRANLAGIKICGTGGLLYHNAESELKNHTEFDACLLNFTTGDIIRYIENDYDNLRNVVYRVDGKIIRAPAEYPENGFSYPVPLHNQLPLNKYNLSHGRAAPVTSVLASYGCPMSCRFCVAERIEYRYRDPDNVIEELDAVKQLGVKEIFFRDNFFCANKTQGYSIMEGIIKRKYGFSWVADTRADIITGETAEVMKRSGCHALHIGVEGANPEISNRYGKGLSPKQVKAAFAICKAHGIKTVGYFIIGLPPETMDDIKRTIDFSIQLDCDYASFNIAIPIIGTSLRDQAINNGWLGPDPDSEYDGSLGSSLDFGNFSRQEITDMCKLAYKRFYLRPSYAVKRLSGIRNLYQMKMLAGEFLNFLQTMLAV